MLNVWTEHVAQSLVHQMRRRMVAHRSSTRVLVDGSSDRVADFQLASLDFPDMADDIGLNFVRVFDAKQRQARAAFGELAAIADLTARFRIERRFVEDDKPALTGDQRVDGSAALVQRHDPPFIGQRLIAAKTRLRSRIGKRLAGLELRRSARAVALRLHRTMESRFVDRHAALATHVRGEIERKTERIVERERRCAVENLVAASGELGERLVENPDAVLDRFAESLFFGPEHLRDAVFVLCKLRIGIAHRAIEIVDHPMEERFFLPQLVAVTDCAANDPPQHVSATFTARNDAIDDQELHAGRQLRENARDRFAAGRVEAEELRAGVSVHRG